jgi:hypothetical protein
VSFFHLQGILFIDFGSILKKDDGLTREQMLADASLLYCGQDFGNFGATHCESHPILI